MLATETRTAAIAAPLPSQVEASLDWKQIVEPVEPFLTAVAHRLEDQVASFEPEIANYARYALTNQGKQLRPALVALSASATGRLTESHVTVAVIIEMVHLATLVHDDVMDEAEIRRGRPTVATNWGNEISVLLGDCLFAQALRLAAGFPTTEICRAVSSATKTVCTGEILQTQRRRNFGLSRAEYFHVLEMKTAELFALSCDLGAYLAEAPEERRSDVRQYGLALGTAYQIYDDCLDLYGTETAVGKSLGTDLAKGKLTLPLLLSLEQARPSDRQRLQRMIHEWEPSHLPLVVEIIEKCDALTQARDITRKYLQAARKALSSLPKNDGSSGLSGLTAFLEQQTVALGRQD